MGPPADVSIQHQVATLVAVLSAARKRRGDLPQRRLAALVGVATQTVQDWEAGADAPTLKHLIAWARLVDFKVALLDGLGQEIRRPLARERDEEWIAYEIRRLTTILRELRNAHPRFTQRDLAVRVGVSRISILRWENNESPPRLSGLFGWARALDCQVGLVPLRTA